MKLEWIGHYIYDGEQRNLLYKSTELEAVESLL